MCQCRKLSGKFGVQKMADLLKVRCLEVPPFTNCGADMFVHTPSGKGDLN